MQSNKVEYNKIQYNEDGDEVLPVPVRIRGTDKSLPYLCGANWLFVPNERNHDTFVEVARSLQQEPLAVLHPGNPYAGYGLASEKDTSIYVFTFNWKVLELTRMALKDGKPRSPDLWLTMKTAFCSDPFVPNLSFALTWAVAELDSRGLRLQDLDKLLADESAGFLQKLYTNRGHYDHTQVVAKLKGWGIYEDLPLPTAEAAPVARD